MFVLGDLDLHSGADRGKREDEGLVEKEKG
jgi:hypothetical protein